MSRLGSVGVVGTLVMDLIAYAPRQPSAGETVLGSHYKLTPGGKGLNQAIAAARAGARVVMLGAVGDDLFGRRLLQELDAEEVDTSFVLVDELKSTGAGFPLVVAKGINSIVVVPGAGGLIDSEYLERSVPAIGSVDVISLQLELSGDSALTAARLGAAGGAIVLLNPAPAEDVSDELLDRVDVLVPNELEAERLSGITDPARAALALASRRPGMKVAVTCGSEGAVAVENNELVRFPALEVNAVDTVGAGDVLCGYLAAGLASGTPFFGAVAQGVAAASMSVALHGGAISAPFRSSLPQA